MKSITLHLPIKPYSVNSMFYGNRSIKRRETVEWEMSIINLLKHKDVQEEIEVLRSTFDYKKHEIHVDLEFYYPKDILITKKNVLSSRAFDVTNVEKPLIDVIFLKKYSTKTVRNIEVDDKYITSLSSKKLAGEKHLIKVNVSLKDLNTYEEL